MLTRIPMPFLRDLTPKEMGQSSIFFPLVGAGVGAWLIGIHWLCRHLWDDVSPIPICTLIAWIGVTGGFHLDGLMDTCDGIFSGKPRAEMLRIMKDSHVGAFGVIGLVCILLLKSGGLRAMEAGEMWKGLLIAPIMGRWSMTYAATVFRYAREEGGLGAAFAEFSDWKCLLLASIFTGAVVRGVFRQEAFVLIPPVVAFICTENLDSSEIVRATVESIAENLVDGVTAPMFYALIGGAPAALAYKAANTLDSMVGYKNERYRDFGWASAKFDDWVNFVPARLTGILIPVVVAVLQFDGRDSWRIFWRDRKKHPSPNSAHAEAAFAGALNVRLGGTSTYQGVPSHKPYLGDQVQPLNPQTIRRAQLLMWGTSTGFLILGWIVWLIIGGLNSTVGGSG